MTFNMLKKKKTVFPRKVKMKVSSTITLETIWKVMDISGKPVLRLNHMPFQ